MAKRTIESVTIYADEYRALLKRHNLRQADGAWLCDMSERQGANWARNGVRGAPAIILKAFDEGLIPLKWFASKVERPIP